MVEKNKCSQGISGYAAGNVTYLPRVLNDLFVLACIPDKFEEPRTERSLPSY
jgi:hypothetical protein